MKIVATYMLGVLFVGGMLMGCSEATPQPSPDKPFSKNPPTPVSPPIDLFVNVKSRNVDSKLDSENFTGITYGRGVVSGVVTPLFVSVGSSESIYYSQDGISWSAASGSEKRKSQSLHSVAYGEVLVNGTLTPTFVAVGDDAVVYHSVDGISWSKVHERSDFSHIIFHSVTLGTIRENGGSPTPVFVAAGSSRGAFAGRFYLSENGKDWKEQRPLVNLYPYQISDLIYEGNRFIALTGISGRYEGVSLTDKKFENPWDIVNTPVSSPRFTKTNLEVYYNSVARSDNLLVVVGRYYWTRNVLQSFSYNLLYYSEDMRQLLRANGDFTLTGGLHGVAYGEDVFVAVGENTHFATGHIYTTVNGKDWTRRPVTIPKPLRDVAYGGGVFVAVGDGGGVFVLSK